MERLKLNGKIDSFTYVNAEGRPDFEVERGGHVKTVECKNVLKGFRYANGDCKVDFQRTRNQLGETARTGRYYKVTEFDILAACEFNQTRRWEFKFVRTAKLPIVLINGVECLVKAVRVPPATSGTPWVTDLAELFD